MRWILLVIGLAGCPWVGPKGVDRLQDADGDGVDSPRYGGRDCDDTDPSVGDCDADQDGHLTAAFDGDDCDDSDAAINPDAPERCDGIDNDCDGAIDDEDTVPDELNRRWYADADGDGFGDGAPQVQCAAPPGHVETALDCDDSNSSVNPTALELCDAIDHDCDGDLTAGASDTVAWYSDADGDGYGDAAGFLELSCAGPGGDAVPNGDDCDDTDPAAHPVGSPPDSTEVCDGIDNDCDGLVDDADPGIDPASQDAFFVDGDSDGYGANEVLACTPPSGTVPAGGDCDDGNALVSPGAAEICGGVDDDCDGLVDGLDDDLVATVWYLDNDGDGVGQPGDTLQQCTQPVGYVAIPGDCNDFDPTISDEVTFFQDNDGDGFGDVNGQPTSGCVPPVGFVRQTGDCDDSEPAVSPAALEICNGLDDDCDGLVDDDPLGAALWFLDADGDGFGAGTPAGPGCRPDDGQQWTQSGSDCDDTNPAANPAGVEVCDGGADNDCDGLADDADASVQLLRWYRDGDGDGFGRDNIFLDQCDAPSGYVADGTDCDDLDPTRYAALVNLPDGDIDTLEEAASVLCDEGTVLVDPSITLDVAVELDISMTVLSADVSQPVVIAPASGVAPAFTIPQFRSLVLEDVIIQGTGMPRSTPIFDTAGLSSLGITRSRIEGFDLVGTGFIQGDGSVVAMRDVDIDQVNADLGIVDIPGVTLSLEDLRITDLTGSSPPDAQGALLVRALASSIVNINGLTCERCVGPSLISWGTSFFPGTGGMSDVVLIDSDAPLLLDGPFTVIEATFVGPGPVTRPAISVGPSGGLSLALADFESTGGIASAGPVTADVISMVDVGAPGVPVFQVAAPVILFVPNPVIEVNAARIVDPAGPIESLGGRLAIATSRIVRPGAVSPWLYLRGNSELRNSIIAEGASPIGSDFLAGQIHNTVFIEGDDDLSSYTGARSHSVFIGPPAGPPIVVRGCGYCMNGPNASLPTGGFDGNVAPIALADPFLTYSPDVDSALWIPVFDPGQPFPFASGPNWYDSGEADWDFAGNPGDRGLTGGDASAETFYADPDNDGMWNGWEDLHRVFSYTDGEHVCLDFPHPPRSDPDYCGPGLDGAGDCDCDGLLDVDELAAGTWPSISDTDGDGCDDGADPAPLVDGAPCP